MEDKFSYLKPDRLSVGCQHEEKSRARGVAVYSCRAGSEGFL